MKVGDTFENDGATYIVSNVYEATDVNGATVLMYDDQPKYYKYRRFLTLFAGAYVRPSS